MKLPQYKSINDKEISFPDRYRRIDNVQTLNSWLEEISEATAKSEEKALGEYIFRGIKEAKYKNYTSAQRKYIVHDLVRSNATLADFIKMQIEALKGTETGSGVEEKTGVYRNLLPRYYKSLGVEDNDFLYLSFSQHYGGISPLIDFSRNIKKAFHFMTDGVKFQDEGGDDIDNYSSIYYLKVETFKQHISNNENVDFKKKLEFSRELSTTMVIVDKALYVEEKDGRINVISFSNPNIVLQEGCFVYYYNAEDEFEPLEKELYCVDIHKSLAPHIQSEIMKYNNTTIKREDLFATEKDIAEASLKRVFTNIVNTDPYMQWL